MRHEHRDADALAAELRGETYELGSHRDVLREERSERDYPSRGGG
jgi:hypothetical protein